MDTNKDFEKWMGNLMSADLSDVETPHVSLVNAAREKVYSRKKIVLEEHPGWIEKLIAFFRPDLKFYQAGLSLVMICVVVFCTNSPGAGSVSAADFMEDNDALSIRNTTISVNSSTMLTSIPTTVIRN